MIWLQAYIQTYTDSNPPTASDILIWLITVGTCIGILYGAILLWDYFYTQNWTKKRGLKKQAQKLLNDIPPATDRIREQQNWTKDIDRKDKNK